jgi:hypothetical protein
MGVLTGMVPEANTDDIRQQEDNDENGAASAIF